MATSHYVAKNGFNITLMYTLAKVVMNISHVFWKCFKGFTFDSEQASACLKQFQQVSFYSIVSVSLAYLTKQGCCS